MVLVRKHVVTDQLLGTANTTILDGGGAAATLYTDRTGASTAANNTVAAVANSVSFFAEPGRPYWVKLPAREPWRVELADQPPEIDCLSDFRDRGLTTAVATNLATLSGTVHCVFFTAERTMMVGGIQVYIGGVTGAGASATAGMAIYTSDTSSRITGILGAPTVADAETALTGTISTAPVADLASRVQVNGGQRYAVGVLFVAGGGGTQPQLTGHAAPANASLVRHQQDPATFGNVDTTGWDGEANALPTDARIAAGLTIARTAPLPFQARLVE